MRKYALLFALLISPFLFSQNYYHDTQGKLEVSNSGSATYTLPIAMPPSIQDVGPIINLAYNSGQLGGIAGQGWSINSISTISRISTRKDIDGFIDGVDFDNNDKLALDGQRLILKTGTYFVSGSTYETETFSNTKIQLIGSGSSIYFIVTAPDGSRSWYGNYGGTNATDLTAFYITRFEDANGNYFTYHYTKVSNAIYIDEIRFSANTISSITPQNIIKFNYEASKRIESTYIKGVKLEKGKMLKNIEVRTNGQLFRKYIITHTVDPQLGYERVTKLQEFNGNNEPANPVIFEYETTSMDNTDSETVSTYTSNLNFNDVKISGDFDGDGRLDFIADKSLYANLFSGASNSKTAELPSTVGRLSTITTLKNNKLNQFNSVLSLEAPNNTTELKFRIYSLTGNAFINDHTKVIFGSSLNGNSSVSDIVGDFNGDGISEVFYKQIVTYNPCTGQPDTLNLPCDPGGSFNIRLLDLNPNSSTVDGSQGLINLNSIASNFSFFNKNIVMDFNGDGKDDILSIHHPETTNSISDKSYKIFSFKHLTTAPWVELEVIGSGVLEDYTKKKQLLFGDFNGDGKTDLMLPDSEGGEGHALWHIYYSNPNPSGGSFFVKESHEIVEYRPDTGTPGTPGAAYQTQVHYSNYYAMDTNGDGKSDLVRVWRKHYKDTGIFNWNDHNTQWTVTSYVNNIGNTQVADKFQLDYQSPCQTMSYNGTTFNNCNHNSDSPSLVFPVVSNYSHAGIKQDMVIVHNHYNRIFYIKFKKDVAEDVRLKKVTSSGGNIVDMIGYSSLEPTTITAGNLGALNDFYSSGDAVTYPFVELKRIPMSKVVSVLINQTQNVTKLQAFKYHGLVVNMDGIGAIGFRKTARSEWQRLAAGTVKAIWNVTENNYLWRGATERNYSQLFNDSNAFAFVSSGNPAGIINSTVNAFDYTILPNKVFKISLNSQTTSNYLSDFKTIKTYTYSEPYLLPETIITRNYFRISKASLLQGTYTTENEFENNPTGTGNTYYIGRPKKTLSKSAAYMEAIEFMEEKYTYTGNKLTKTEKRPNDTGYYLTEDFEYFANGNLKKKTLSAPGSAPWTAPRSTEYTYDASERFIKTVKDIEGLVTTNNTYHPLYGVVLNETNPFQHSTVSVYDNWGKRTKVTDYLGKSVNYSYTKSGFEYTTYQYADDGSESKVIADALGRTVKSGSKNINGTWSYTNTEYDYMGRKTRSSQPYFDGGSPSQWSTITYDDYSRVKQTVDHTGLNTTITYSSVSLFDSGAKVTIDDGTKVTSTTKNSNGHTISATDSGGTITYTYYSNGNLKTSTFDGTTLTMEYDLWGRKSKLHDPSAETYHYEYYPFGEIYKEITPKGVTQYDYTPSGKILVKTVVGHETYLHSFYSYNTNKQLVLVDGYDQQGNPFSTQYEYDGNLRVKKTIETNPQSIFEKEFVYDDFGRLSREKSKATDVATGKSSTKWIRNTYLNGHHWQILDDATNAMLWQVDLVNERGQLVTGHYGNSVGRISNLYDAYGMPRVTQYRTINGNYSSLSPFLRLDTDFYAAKGLLNKRINSMFNLTENFQYDSQERLTHFSNITGQTEQQAYDNKGRIIQNSTGTYSYDTQKAYRATKITLSPEASTYYNQRPLQQVIYNAFKSPVSIYEQGKERIDFEYNLFQTRTAMYYGNDETDKNLRPLRKYYSADGVMEIKRNINTGAVDFITYIGGDGYTAPIIVKSDGTTQNYYYLHRDYLGSIMAVTNAAGQVVEKRHFDAWGNIVKLQNGSGANLTDFVILDRGYTGHEHLLKVGLINMNGRLYDPKVHRFLAPDNFIQDPTNTQNFNRYGYVLNNPLKYTDPSGEEFISFGLAVGIGAFIAATTYSIQAGYTYGFQASGWGFLKSTLIGAASAAVSFGIGEVTQTITNYATKIATQAVMHGVSQGMVSGVQGGDFWTGFASGSVSSLASSFWSGGETIRDNSVGNSGNYTMSRTVYGGAGSLGRSTVGMISFGTVMGGAGAALTGGNFWQGAVTGLVVSGLNHAMHSGDQEDPLKRFKKDAISLEKWQEIYADKSYYEIITEMPWRKDGMPGGPKFRYVINPVDGNVMDMRHVAIVGYQLGDVGGRLVEHIQWATGDPTKSAYDPQDFYSNRIGNYFERLRLQGSWASDSWAYDFKRFIETQFSNLIPRK